MRPMLLSILILLVLVLFLLPIILARKKYNTPAALLVFALNLSVVCLLGLLFPFYRRWVLQAIFIFLVIVNLAVFWIPRRWELSGRFIALSTPSLVGMCVWSLFVTATCLGGTEWMARVLTAYGILTYYHPMQTMLKRGTEDWRRAHITADIYREPDPVLFWRPVAEYPYNSQHFKGPVAAVPKPPGVYRIMCYGDSNTDWPAQGSWPEQLQRLLDKDRKGNAPRYEVLNAGVAGYSSYQGLLRFRQEVATYTPDLIFVSFGWNDGITALGQPDKAFQPPHPFVVAVQRLLFHYRFYLVLKSYASRLSRFQASRLSRLQQPTSAAAAELPPRVSLEDYVANLQGFLDTATQHDASVVLLTRPHIYKLDELLADSGWRRRVPSYHQALLNLAKERNVRVVDVYQLFAANDRHLFEDECHFTVEGHQVMADLIYEDLLRNNVLPARLR